MADPGEGSGGPASPLFLDQIETRKAKKHFFETARPLSKVLDNRPPPPHPHPLSQGLDPALYITLKVDFKKFKILAPIFNGIDDSILSIIRVKLPSSREVRYEI